MYYLIIQHLMKREENNIRTPNTLKTRSNGHRTAQVNLESLEKPAQQSDIEGKALPLLVSVWEACGQAGLCLGRVVSSRQVFSSYVVSILSVGETEKSEPDNFNFL